MRREAGTPKPEYRTVATEPLFVALPSDHPVTSRPPRGEAQTIDLVIGHHRASTSPVLLRFLDRGDALIARVRDGRRRPPALS